MRSASAASISRAVMISSFARPSPTTAGSRVEPPTSGMIPNLHLGQAELGVAGGDPQVAAERHLERAADAGAVDLADDRLGHLFAEVGAVEEHLAERAQHAELAGASPASSPRSTPAREHRPFAAQHHAVHARVGGRLAQRGAERPQQLAGSSRCASRGGSARRGGRGPRSSVTTMLIGGLLTGDCAPATGRLK